MSLMTSLPTWTTVHTGAMTKSDALAALQEYQFVVTGAAKTMLEKSNWSSNVDDVELVLLTGEALRTYPRESISNVLRAGTEEGLKPVSPEIGAMLLLQQPELCAAATDSFRLAMHPRGRRDEKSIMYVKTGAQQRLWLNTELTDLGDSCWPNTAMWIFQR